MSLAPIATGSTTKSTRSGNPSFQDPGVRGALRSLHAKIDMLADIGGNGRALITKDAYTYGAKPYCKRLLDNNTYPPLKQLAAGGPSHRTRDNQIITHASIQYGWFVNALAGRIVNILISESMDSIFGKGAFRAKVEAKLANYQTDREKCNYLKRTYASSIKRWYVSHRLSIISDLSNNIKDDFIDDDEAKELLRIAIAAKRANMSVGAYLKANPRRSVGNGGNGGYPYVAPAGVRHNFSFNGFRNTTAPSSSSSSSRELENPEEIDLGN